MKTATKDSIITLPNPNLRSKSSRVGAVSVELKKIIDDMKAATLDWEKSRPHEVGVALAAIQIDQPYRIIIVRNNPDDKSDTGFSVFINPKITKLEGDIEVEHEGCLSVKDIYGKEFKALPKEIIPYLSTKFEPRAFSVVCYAKVGRIEQRLLAILKRTAAEKGDRITVKKIYWL